MEYITADRTFYAIRWSNGEFLRDVRGFEGVPIQEATFFKNKAEALAIYNMLGKDKIVSLFSGKKVTRDNIVKFHLKTTMDIKELEELY